MVKQKQKKPKWIKPVLITISLLLLLLLLNCSGTINIDVSNQGHGIIHRGSGSSLLQSLGIQEDYDYVDDEGNGYCFDDDCWDMVEAEYDECIGGEVMFSSAEPSFFEIIPSACAIAPDLLYDECEEEYYNSLMTECSVRCEEETYTWNGIPVNDLGEFTETAFPDFTEQSETSCEFFGGDWISQSDKVGCINHFMIFCSSNSLQSAGEVCTTINKNWVCDRNNAYCED